MQHVLIAVIAFLLLGSGPPLAFAERESDGGKSGARQTDARSQQPTARTKSAGAARTGSIGGSKTETTKESGEKAGTEDINIGVGELQE